MRLSSSRRLLGFVNRPDLVFHFVDLCQFSTIWWRVAVWVGSSARDLFFTCGSVARWFCVGSSMSPAISCRSCFLFDLLRSRHSVSCGSSQLVRVSSSASDLVLSSLPVVSLVRSTLGQSSDSQRLSMCVSPVHPIVVGISWVSVAA